MVPNGRNGFSRTPCVCGDKTFGERWGERFRELGSDVEILFHRRWNIPDFGERWKDKDNVDIGSMNFDLGHAAFRFNLSREPVPNANADQVNLFMSRIDDGMSPVRVRMCVSDSLAKNKVAESGLLRLSEAAS